MVVGTCVTKRVTISLCCLFQLLIMSLIADIAWIKRGVPKAVPDKVKLSAGEIRTLIQGSCFKGFFQSNYGFTGFFVQADFMFQIEIFFISCKIFFSELTSFPYAVITALKNVKYCPHLLKRFVTY